MLEIDSSHKRYLRVHTKALWWQHYWKQRCPTNTHYILAVYSALTESTQCQPMPLLALSLSFPHLLFLSEHLEKAELSPQCNSHFLSGIPINLNLSTYPPKSIQNSTGQIESLSVYCVTFYKLYREISDNLFCQLDMRAVYMLYTRQKNERQKSSGSCTAARHHSSS